jgi:hypothetical protein
MSSKRVPITDFERGDTIITEKGRVLTVNHSSMYDNPDDLCATHEYLRVEVPTRDKAKTLLFMAQQHGFHWNDYLRKKYMVEDVGLKDGYFFVPQTKEINHYKKHPYHHSFFKGTYKYFEWPEDKKLIKGWFDYHID